ncbi:MAG: Rep [Cressdnaviricota sp.]|nr:MAG: Rep [Cressdnaviricota sp.]
MDSHPSSETESTTHTDYSNDSNLEFEETYVIRKKKKPSNRSAQDLKSGPSKPQPEDTPTFSDPSNMMPGNTLDDDNFRLSNKYVLLTYKTHLPKEDYIEWILNEKGHDLEFVRVAHESADKSNPYLHSHVLIAHATKFDIRSCRALDYKGIHPHFRRLPYEKNFKRAKVYISKEDPDCADLKPKEKPSIIAAIASCSSDAEAMLKYCENPSQANGILAIRSACPPPPKPPRKPLINPDRPWQKFFLELHATVPSDRHVYWLFDATGNMGKSQFSRYMMHTYPTQWHFCRRVATMRDFATVVESALHVHWDQWGWVFDLPKSIVIDSGFYECLECLKDGMITSTKFKGKSHILDIPHVIVFSNTLPDINYLSEDRWKIYNVSEKSGWDIVPIPTKSVPRLRRKVIERLQRIEEGVYCEEVCIDREVRKDGEFREDDKDSTLRNL